MFDARLKRNFKMIIAGPSECGKTTKVMHFLRHQEELFQSGSISNVIYCYRQWQDKFDELQSEGLVQEWLNEIPTRDIIREKTLPYKEQNGSLLIIDDFNLSLTKDCALLFNVLSAHCSCSVMLLTQNIFNKDPVFREISLNSNYIIICKSPRDKSQIMNFAKQFNPTNTRFVVESFQHATRFPYSYLLFDATQSCPPLLSVRTKIFPHEIPMVVYTPGNHSLNNV